MRKLILISALLLASATAQAGQGRNLILAANEEPKAVETIKPAETKSDAAPAAATEAATETKAETAKTSVKPSKKVHARRYDGDEAKARRIAARYGVYW